MVKLSVDFTLGERPVDFAQNIRRTASPISLSF
jgi:hypothetical protein